MTLNSLYGRSSTLLCLAFMSAIFYSLGSIHTTRAAEAEEPAKPGGTVLCLPGVYWNDPEDCLLAGPSAYLTQMAKHGITFPLQPLPTAQADSSLAVTPFRYARLKEGLAVPIYSTLEEAMGNGTPTKYIEAGGLRYVSYIQEAYADGGTKPKYFQLHSGGWISAGFVASRENATIQFQGLAFQRTPVRSFGWILPFNPFVETKRSPGYQREDYTGHKIIEYGEVQIYATQTVSNTAWYLVGPDEWVEQSKIGRVIPNPTPPEGVTNGRWIEVNLFEQTVAVYDQDQLIYATLMASGSKPFYTRPGLFPIYKKLDATPMQGSFEADRSDFYYLEDVPWTLYYDQARALHTAYWRTRFGFPQSHGCVNLSPGDAHWLFNWAREGDWVYVWDPSGETPTDPNYYTQGGA